MTSAINGLMMDDVSIWASIRINQNYKYLLSKPFWKSSSTTKIPKWKNWRIVEEKTWTPNSLNEAENVFNKSRD
jgi:hypothetical protein